MKMRSRSVAAAIVVSALCAGGAVACFVRSSQLRNESEWLLARGTAQGQAYAQTFDNKLAEDQLTSLEQRRDLLERARRWQRFQLMFIMACVVSAFSSYVLYLFFRLRQQLVEVADDEIHAA
jgi:hypothetical protein